MSADMIPVLGDGIGKEHRKEVGLRDLDSQ